MKSFEGRTIMVTGAGKNIGKDIALAFAREGANIVVCDLNSENTDSTVKEIEALGVTAMGAVCDVRDRDRIYQLVTEAETRFGGIDILVNNAGGSAGLLGKLTNFVDAEPETFDFVLDVNIKGAFNCTHAVLKKMIEKHWGKIINISSIAAVCGLKQRTDYAAAKAAMIGMARALALEVGQYNICVNCVSPGAIARDGNTHGHMTHLGEDGRMGDPKDITDTVLFLAQQDYITGQNIVVDGGRSLGPSHR